MSGRTLLWTRLQERSCTIEMPRNHDNDEEEKIKQQDRHDNDGAYMAIHCEANHNRTASNADSPGQEPLGSDMPLHTGIRVQTPENGYPEASGRRERLP